MAFLVIFAVGGVIATQVAQLAGDLPGYEANMRSKIKSLRGTTATTTRSSAPLTSFRTLARN